MNDYLYVEEEIRNWKPSKKLLAELDRIIKEIKAQKASTSGA